ncbi:MAG TPA: outer membrane beta-barrel family protein [Flavitalea sp.]|nr:outer membrane beta-barrel family protein [Flavitalea sp.]
MRLISLLVFIISLCVSVSLRSHGQSVVAGTMQDENGKAIQYASVHLLKAADSSLLKGAMSDAAGKYSFHNIPIGKYIVSSTYTGMSQAFSKIIEVTSGKKQINAGILKLGTGTEQLKDVTVIGKRPMFEQKIDRMVINVQNSIVNAGGTALDVLEKSPGVTVNRQNNSIAVNGKNGVVVMLNGKMTYMPMDALVQMLAGISAGNIDKIELITTPPSKYDAEGNAGYINIVLISNPYQGLNGSYFLTAGYGNRELGAAGFNFNYRSGRFNLYGNYSFTYDHALQRGDGFTQFNKGGNIISNYSFSDRDGKRKVHTPRIGVDFQLDSSTVIGALIGGYSNRWTMTADNGATVQIDNEIDTIISTVNMEVNYWKNFMSNVNFQHTFSPGKIIYFDANYIYFKDDNPNTYSNGYFDKGKNLIYNDEVRSGKITPLKFRVFSTDYVTPVGKKITMEVGGKFSLSGFTNDVSVDYLKQGAWVPDPDLSANYKLKENIGAAYTSFTMNVNSKTTLKAGLRFEYTTSNLGTTTIPDIVDRKYGELFPTFYISRKFNEEKSFNFSYSRRITRPTFNDLAPFTIFFDPKTFFTGNPALQPAIANAAQASYIFKNYIFSLGYTYEKNSIEGFQTVKIDTLLNMLYLSAKNFDYEQFLTASVSLPVAVNKWWTVQNNVNLNWRQVNTIYDNAPVQLQVVYYNVISTHRFTLPKDFSIELGGMYTSASYFGTAKLGYLYQVDAGLQKKFNRDKDLFRFSANDIFNSGSNYRFDEKLPIPGAVMTGSLNFGLVAFKLTYTHKFGNKNLKDNRDRTTGAENELQRVHN